jgi:hypothetical protein
MAVKIVTGNALSALIDIEDPDRIITEASYWYAFNVDKYPKEQTVMTGLSPSDFNKALEMAEKIRDGWKKSGANIGEDTQPKLTAGEAALDKAVAAAMEAAA